MLAGRRALHKCPPHCCNLIGGEFLGAELKLVSLHVGLQFTAIFCTNSSSSENMASFLEKHLIYPSNGVPKSMADLRRYEGFFPNMNGATYDPISLLNEEKNRRNREPSFSPESTTASHADDIFSNTVFAFSRYLFREAKTVVICYVTALLSRKRAFQQPAVNFRVACPNFPKLILSSCLTSPKEDRSSQCFLACSFQLKD